MKKYLTIFIILFILASCEEPAQTAEELFYEDFENLAGYLIPFVAYYTIDSIGNSGAKYLHIARGNNGTCDAIGTGLDSQQISNGRGIIAETGLQFMNNISSFKNVYFHNFTPRSTAYWDEVSIIGTWNE